jgi:hypothetical protein
MAHHKRGKPQVLPVGLLALQAPQAPGLPGTPRSKRAQAILAEPIAEMDPLGSASFAASE